MKVNVIELSNSAMLDEPLYPGKRLVKKYAVPGDHKSHCVVFDWHETRQLHVELKAGLTGRSIDAKELRQYPVSYQAPTYLDIMFVDADDEETEGKSGGDSGGLSMKAFGKAMGGKIPTRGEIKKFVVMGKELAKESYAAAYENLKAQLAQVKVMAIDLMQGVIKRATPGGGLQAKCDEVIKYKYDAEKTAPMFGGMTPT